MKIKGYILDIDNTLLSSTDAHYQSWIYALESNGVYKGENEIKIQFGKPTNKIAELLCNGDKSLGTKIAKEKTNYLIEIAGSVKLFPGVEEILNWLFEHNYPICFASSNFNKVIEAFMEHNGWNEISVGYVGIDDVVNAKPDPEMIVKAINKTGLKPEDCVMVGDSLYDVEAGNRAGSTTIAVCTGHNSKSEFNPYNPTLILDKFSDIKPLLPLDLNV